MAQVKQNNKDTFRDISTLAFDILLVEEFPEGNFGVSNTVARIVHFV